MLHVIIDYGMCNLDSVARAVEKCGGTALVTGDPRDLNDADAIILPGVGAFPDAMAELQARSLVGPIKKLVLEDKVPFLGICLGMQLMASRGFENRETPGLGLIPGEVVRLIPEAPSIRIPHVGWNEVLQTRASVLFKDIPNHRDFYFVHSYHFCCEAQYVLGRTPYCNGFNSVIGIGHCFGLQFHPEKSLRSGLKLLNNFLSLC